ncbi:MAG TPA: hydrogenase maturation protease [Polyangia bacterium]
MSKVLIAGVGNLFLGDDGFGVEVARRLAEGPLPDGVEVFDAGIRGLHLAYRLLDGYELLVAVDAVSRGGEPGTVYVIEPELDDDAAKLDAHSLDLPSVFAMVRTLGGQLGRVLVVGCEPAAIEEGIGLSPSVQAAVEPTVQRIRQLTQAA